ncbi:hypothetical protein GIB67_029664 [Kingdonia uniflora]|uniref:Ubiquitin-like protease family profile domain-containing protein n=1 Tax=Kingdonia uniflora TaxID=39325 RepID=A0A7J7LLE9_9MAGN|nr:hypothetical protein GIB67_029664 [Kingdonia uniflora]
MRRNRMLLGFDPFSEHFEDVIYPKGDPDAVSISKSDVELLRPETFINDTVIDFYIKYLETKIRTEDKHRFHFFNSFFFRKLADLDKTPSSASEGRAAFQRVRKWTRKVNLFEKDYIFIPVNFNLHWSLLVICHPDEETEGFPKVPCILHMDSIKGSHKGLKNLVQSYLWEEWKERHAESSEDVSKKFLNLRFISLELPQQENSYDCGLFLLHYVELFLEDAPVHFSPFKITKFSNFLGIDWFQPAEASLKRALIQRLIYKLLQDDTQKIPPTDCDEEYQCPRSNENCDGRENMELHSEINRPQNSWHGSSMPFTADEEIERKLLPISPGNAQHMGSSEFIFKDLFEPGTSNGSFPNGQFRAFERTIPYQKFKGMSPVEEDEETGEQFVFSLNVGNSPPIAEFTSPHAHKSGTPHHSKKFGSFDASWNPDFSVIQEEEGNGASSSETSTSGSQTSSDVILDQNPRSESPENSQSSVEIPTTQSLENCIVADSQEAEDEETQNYISFCQNLPPEDSIHNVDLIPDNLHLRGNDIALESDEHRASKRQRVMPQLGRV